MKLMKLKLLGALKSKFLKPCKKLFLSFKLKLKKPLLIRRTIRRRRSPARKARSSPDRDEELKALPVSSTVNDADTFVKEKEKRALVLASGNEDVEDSCRSFENYLVQMIVEEGKMRDLIDVEELLYCWRNLKSPVFMDLVSTFYGELCKDLFSTHDHTH